MIRRVVPAVVAALSIGATLWAYSEITILRGTVFWEFRFLVLMAGAFLVLTIAEKVLSRLLPPEGEDEAH